MQILLSCPDRYGGCFLVYRNEISSHNNNILDFGGKSENKNRSFRAGCVEHFPFQYWGGKVKFHLQWWMHVSSYANWISSTCPWVVMTLFFMFHLPPCRLHLLTQMGSNIKDNFQLALGQLLFNCSLLTVFSLSPEASEIVFKKGCAQIPCWDISTELYW